MMRLISMLMAVQVSFASPSGEPAKTATVEVSKVRPTQMQVGAAAVAAVARVSYIDKAIGDDAELAEFKCPECGAPGEPARKPKDLSLLTPAQRLRLREKLADYLQRNPPKPVRAIRGPDGNVYITDGHHRTTALEWLSRSGTPPLLDSSAARIRVLITDDFVGRGEEFARFVANKGFFLREQREKHRSKTLSDRQLLESLPRSMSALLAADSPLRSTIGKLFFDYGIDGEHFEEYIEFFIGEQVACEVGAKPGYEFERVTLERAARAVFGNPDVVAYLKSKALAEPRKSKAEAQIASAVARYEKAEVARLAAGGAAPVVSDCTAEIARAAKEMARETISKLTSKLRSIRAATEERDASGKTATGATAPGSGRRRSPASVAPAH